MKLLASSLLGIASVTAGFAHNTPASEPWRPTAYADRLTHAPRPLPDRIVLTWRQDPATTQAVTWRTDASVVQGVAEIALANEQGRELRARAVPAVTTEFESNLGPANFHTAEFTDLTPDTLYAYRVGDGANWSEWFQFRTASRTARPFSFIYFGDAQNDIKTHWSRVFREAFREAPRAAFTLHAGDLVSEGNNDEQWGEWFGAPAWVNATIPVVATPGNHEYRRADERDEKSPRVLSRHWRPQFALPENGPAGVPELIETTYFFDYQGARIISLNSNTRQAEQQAWLREVLSQNPQRWTIVTFHHPIFSPARDRDHANLRAAWKPLFDEFKVDLVLTGHDHTYARSGDLGDRIPVGTVNAKPGYQQIYDPAIGTVYVVSVSGPKMYKLTGGEWAVRTAENTQLFQVVTVNGDELRFEARTAVNRLHDAFTLRKRPGQANELIEHLPPQSDRSP
ncbi:metallophosphoesterase family protein [Oleiharenicola lentus]|uniref:Metallophosphoesterase family protein n=1 Tax=Oleiharenicola lentus TaxID=2508720 RepID=A0A4Q1CA33_9BACT|nr:metallophosphoesterase family protein [Oleiharenicola lentus]RXK55905.1 metallophosphoesterase family protein [Oleiharenicola lentus]